VGELPGNPVIRMTRDPMCARINAGKQVVQETVMASLDGSMANVFVQLEGSFPDTPVPTEPVTIDQRGCVYTPRVVGVRLGQLLHDINAQPTMFPRSFFQSWVDAPHDFCLDLFANSPAEVVPGTLVQQFTCNDTPAQRWILQPV